MKRILILAVFSLFLLPHAFAQTEEVPDDLVDTFDNEESDQTDEDTQDQLKKSLELKKLHLPGQNGNTAETDSLKNLFLKPQPDTPPVAHPKKKSLPRVTIFGQAFFRNRNIAAFDKTGASRAPDNYILSSSDKINISVWGYADYSGTFVINEEGFIQPKETGRIYLKGVRFGDAQELIEKKFGGFLDLKNSKIDVTLAAARTITVNIVGEVNTPGSYTIPAINTAFNALILADGTNSIGSVRNIYIRRGGKTIRTLDIYNFLLSPDKNEDFFLENNDYIVVPPANLVIKMEGEVGRSFKYEIKEGESLQDAIRFAGGLTSAAYNRSIEVKRIQDGRTFFINLSLDSLNANKKSFTLLNGDEVQIYAVPDRPEGYVFIIGAIRVPGRYEYLKGEKISGLLKRSKGILDASFQGKAYIVRKNPDLTSTYFSFNLNDILQDEKSPENVELNQYDIVQIFEKSKFLDPDSIDVYGSVREPGKILFGDKLTVKDAIFLSGGFKKEAANNRIEISRLSNIGRGAQDTTRVIILTAKINYDLSLDKDVSNFVLQPYDKIFIRKLANFNKQEDISLSGEVLYPGIYSIIKPDEKLFDVINRAGGLTERAFLEGTEFVREADSIGMVVIKLNKKEFRNPNSVSNYILKGGDHVHIPTVNELIAIKGAINYPGIDTLGKINAPLIAKRRAKYYVNNFGIGFAKDAKRTSTYVMYAGGFVGKTKNFGLFRVYPKVKKGSSIVVNYKEGRKDKNRKRSKPIDWNKTIEGLTVKLTGLLTLYLIITQLKK